MHRDGGSEAAGGGPCALDEFAVLVEDLLERLAFALGDQGLLLLGGRSAKRQEDAEHPFGYGRERYFYAFVVALVLAARVAGEETAKAIQLMIEYDPQPPFDNGSLAKCNNEIVTRVIEYAQVRK